MTATNEQVKTKPYSARYESPSSQRQRSIELEETEMKDTQVKAWKLTSYDRYQPNTRAIITHNERGTGNYIVRIIDRSVEGRIRLNRIEITDPSTPDNRREKRVTAIAQDVEATSNMLLDEGEQFFSGFHDIPLINKGRSIKMYPDQNESANDLSENNDGTALNHALLNLELKGTGSAHDWLHQECEGQGIKEVADVLAKGCTYNARL
jgi:hypothetical protein